MDLSIEKVWREEERTLKAITLKKRDARRIHTPFPLRSFPKKDESTRKKVMGKRGNELCFKNNMFINIKL